MTINKEAVEDTTLPLSRWRQKVLGRLWRGKCRKLRGGGAPPFPFPPALTNQASLSGNVGTDLNDINNIFRDRGIKFVSVVFIFDTMLLLGLSLICYTTVT